MAKQQWVEPKVEVVDENHGNTRLPFGLCKRYGISLPEGSTPRDAWNALKGIGITPKQIYDHLKGKGEEPKTEEPKQETPTEEPKKEEPKEEPKQEEKKKTIDEMRKETKFDEISKRERGELVDYVSSRLRYFNYNAEEFAQRIKYLGYKFPDTAKLPEDEIKKIVDLISEASKNVLEEYKYIKSGKSWSMTKNEGLESLKDNKHLTKEEKEAFEKKRDEKILSTSMTKHDKAIQALYGEGTTVVFGKAYSDEEMTQITDATKVLVNDYPGLKGYVKTIGSRSEVENYVNAQRRNYQPTEEEINKYVEEQKKWGSTRSDEELRQRAVSSMQSPVSFTAMRNAYAYWSPSQKLMAFMGLMKKTTEGDLQRDFDANFHPSNKKISVYYHEMGHAIHSMLEDSFRSLINKSTSWQRTDQIRALQNEFSNSLNELRRRNINKDYDSAMKQRMIEKYGHEFMLGTAEYRETKKELFAEGIKPCNVSRYASTNSAEFVAECFCGHYTDMNNSLCTETVNLFKDTLKKLEAFK